jgi:hypothetical protein
VYALTPHRMPGVAAFFLSSCRHGANVMVDLIYVLPKSFIALVYEPDLLRVSTCTRLNRVPLPCDLIATILWFSSVPTL